MLEHRSLTTWQAIAALATAAALVLACSPDETTSEPQAESQAQGQAQSQAQSQAQAEAPAAEPTKPSTSGNQEARPQVSDSTIQAIDEFIASKKIDKSGSSWKTGLPKPPEFQFDKSKTYAWVLETNAGTMKLELLPDEAPMHVSSAMYLTRLGFFDGLTFHRVIPNFMAQGGDPLGNGRGNPGYRFDGEFGGDARHDKPGILSQANAGPGTDGSQFFITFVPTPHLDGRHTIYGQLVEGLETLKEIESRRQPGSPQMRDPLVIERASLEVN